MDVNGSMKFNPLYMGNPKRVLLQTVKTQMECRIMWHFIRVYTVKVEKDIWTFFFKLQPDTPSYAQWTIPSLMYKTRRKNPLVYKGLKLPSKQRVKGLKYCCGFQ